MPPPRPGLRALVALVCVVAVGGGTWWLLAGGGAERDRSSPTTASEGPAATSRLVFHLARIDGRRLSGRHVRARRLRTAAKAVRRVITDLYTTGFVDRRRWVGGRFPTLSRLFVRATRSRVRRDLTKLSLGPLARQVDAVRPRAGVMGVRFLVAHTPVVAVASVTFRASAIVSDVSLPIVHRGIYTLRRVSGRWRIAAYRVQSHLPTPAALHRKARRAAGAPAPPAGTSFFLVIGSDARPGQAPDATRGDSIHVVGVNAARNAVSILGIPRDSFVPIPGVGTRKINESLFRGGPKLMVRTVERLTGIPILGYVLTGFAGFQDLVNGVGGITVDVPYPMRDPYSGADFGAGRTHMTGRDALAFSRDRHSVPGGDFGRSLNQGRMLIAALRQLKDDVARSPAALLAWVAAGARVLRTDLDLSDMIQLLLSALSVDPGRVQNRVVSGTGAVVGGLDVIRLGASARAMFRDFRADAIFNGRP